MNQASLSFNMLTCSTRGKAEVFLAWPSVCLCTVLAFFGIVNSGLETNTIAYAVVKYHLFSFIVCHKEDYKLYFEEIKGETHISYFQHSPLLLQCQPVHLLLPYFCSCPPAFPTYMLSSDRISVRKHFSSNSILSCCLKALPLALLFDWGECAVRGVNKTHIALSSCPSHSCSDQSPGRAREKHLLTDYLVLSH